MSVICGRQTLSAVHLNQASSPEQQRGRVKGRGGSHEDLGGTVDSAVAGGAQEVLQGEAWVLAGAAWVGGPVDALAEGLAAAAGPSAALQTHLPPMPQALAPAEVAGAQAGWRDFLAAWLLEAAVIDCLNGAGQTWA